jgi:hypothetical protein
MKVASGLASTALLLMGLMLFAPGCVVHTDGYAEGYHEGYWDREHNRWWHDNGWHDCVENDVHCHG